MDDYGIYFYMSDSWRSMPIGDKAKYLISRSDEKRRLKKNENKEIK